MRTERPPRKKSADAERRWLLACVLACSALLGLARSGVAQTSEGALSFAAPPTLVEDDRAELELQLTPPPGGQSWMITLRGEGTAVDVVRGRLLPADVEDPTARSLTLRVPIVARSPGVALVHAELTGWACAETCSAVTSRATTTLHVSARPAG